VFDGLLKKKYIRGMNALLALLTAVSVSCSQPVWKLYSSTPELDILYLEQDCHDEVNGLHRTYVFLKIVNKTDTALELIWLTERYAGGVCKTCGKEEYRQKVVVDARSEISASCEQPNKPLMIFKKHLDLPNSSELERFELGDFQVKKVGNQ
jgi:hypothetical protein